jgi:RimJ/RimL family protein N-acetyltransferase
MSGRGTAKNKFGQPVGMPLPDWSPRPLPPRAALEGRHCRVEPLKPERHAEELFEAFSRSDPTNWTYLPDYMGPYTAPSDWRQWIESAFASDDPLWYAIMDKASGRAVGMAAYLRMDAKSGVIEVGGLNYSKALQRKRAATEAMYLMMRRAFDELGYRRYEWKCDALNAPSRAAAERLGFTYEGIFRQHMVYRGRSRDSAWFSITDQEWPNVRKALEDWLEPNNFDAQSRQKASLKQLRNR